MAFQASEARQDGRYSIPRHTKEPPRFSASQYAKNNSLQRKHNNVVLEFCQPAFLTEPHDTMQILDIGCGTGDFTRDFLLPRCLPCGRLVGIDSSIQMIEYARRHSAHEKIEYELLDIGDDMTEFIGRRGHFDRVFSFYCLQWLRNQGAALKNVAALMRPGGQCLLVFPASHQPGAVWRLLAEMDHWEKYSESHYMKSKTEQIQYMSSLVREAGLCPNILVLPRLVTFDGWSEEDIIANYPGCRLSMSFQASETREDGRYCIPRDTKQAPRFSASQYAKNNSLQRKHNNVVLEFCQPAFLAEPHATMQILDIGCGTGDYTRDFLLPRCLPCDRLVGIDSSIQMIEYAKRHSAHEKIEYELLDIGDDMTEFISRRGHFDRVFSFYCLHWVRNQGAALKNVAALMAPGGQCLLVIPASNQLAAVWRLLAEMDHWVKYSETLLQFISKSHYMKDEKEQIQYMSSLLREAGLCPNIFCAAKAGDI
ncbi:uncharacterized protein [Dermacentor albipictus]|uniref:uncharacterized protein isoform X2 n=1 Tax=Dermacentor albipictus TaxID=60249 RepID=UPI0038FD24A7